MKYAQMTVEYTDLQLGVNLPVGISIVEVFQDPVGRLDGSFEVILQSNDHPRFCRVAKGCALARIFREELDV